MAWILMIGVIGFSYALFFLSLTGFVSLQRKKLTRATERYLQGRRCDACGEALIPWDGIKHPFYEPMETKRPTEQISHLVHVACSSCGREEILAVWTDHSVRATKIPPKRLTDPALSGHLRGDLSVMEFEEPAGRLSTTEH